MKGNMEERDLLREYVEHGSETAFGELVRRHVDLVHSTARRLVCDADLANDVCQAVFLSFARKASSVRKSDALSGWLYRATRFEAASLVRREQRRRYREAEAMRRSELDCETESRWESITPMLDAAMARLKPQDQDVLLLRFFENKPLAEVGQALGLTEEAARKRVSRSLDQLQGWFRKRGIGISTTSLASLLAANAVEAAPAGMAAAMTAAAMAGAATSATTVGLFATLTPALLMTKTTGTILTVLLFGAILTPVLLNRNSPGENSTAVAPPRLPGEASAAAAPRPSRPVTARAAATSSSPASTLLQRVAALPPLSSSEIEAYVQSNKRNAESLLAAYRVSTNISYLTEAAQRFPGDPDVQYAVVASRAAPDVQRQWIEAYKASSPDNALPWYFSALEHYRTGSPKQAIEEIQAANRKPVFRADLAPTLQALQEMHVSAGRSADEGRVAAFQSAAHVPHLGQMRELAKAMQESINGLRQQGSVDQAYQIAGSGLVLGSHLSAGGGSQTLINQLFGIALEQKFLQQLDPSATTDPFGRSVAEVRSAVENHRNSLKEHMKGFAGVIGGLSDVELSTYMERVKLYGEEAALVWVKAKHGAQ